MNDEKIVEETIEEIVGQDEAPVKDDFDWKAAAKKLKKEVEAVTDSIDDYFKKLEIVKLRERYNNKERSKALYESIMKL